MKTNRKKSSNAGAYCLLYAALLARAQEISEKYNPLTLQYNI